jgi:hypothetical protein
VERRSHSNNRNAAKYLKKILKTQAVKEQKTIGMQILGNKKPRKIVKLCPSENIRKE